MELYFNRCIIFEKGARVMRDYVIATECTCDLDDGLIGKLGIKIIPMEVIMEDKTFEHYPDFRNYNAKKFYNDLKEGGSAGTTQINPQKYLNFFTPFLKEGKDILYICFSSGLSSTYNSAIIAKMQLEDEYPNKIEVVDSLAASGGEGLLTILAYENKEKGFSLEENKEWLENNKLKIAHYFTVDDLMFLKRGGRISAATAIVGSALKIKPLLTVDENGKLVSISKAHGRRAAINTLFNYFNDANTGSTVIINHGDCEEDALYLKNKIFENNHNINVMVSYSGPVIGAHTGPGLLTVFFFGGNR